MTDASDLPPQAETRHFEDCQPGKVLTFGSVRIEEAAIVDFARRYDPQPFHVDAEGAAVLSRRRTARL